MIKCNARTLVYDLKTVRTAKRKIRRKPNPEHSVPELSHHIHDHIRPLCRAFDSETKCAD